eukprot:766587-Hanusia_phi.AAC.1
MRLESRLLEACNQVDVVSDSQTGETVVLLNSGFYELKQHINMSSDVSVALRGRLAFELEERRVMPKDGCSHLRVHEEAAEEECEVCMFGLDRRDSIVKSWWRFHAGSSGMVSQVHTYFPFALGLGSSHPSLLLVLGQPWSFVSCRLQCANGIVVRVAESGAVLCEDCVVEGLDSNELRAAFCFSVEHKAILSASMTVMQDAIGAVLRCMDSSFTNVSRCTLQYGAFGMSMDGNAIVRGAELCFRRIRVGALVVLASSNFTHLLLSDCFTCQTEIWGSHRRPRRLTLSDCSFDQSKWETNERRATASEWMTSAVYGKSLRGERQFVEQEPTPARIAKGALIRAEHRKVLRENLNRPIEWMKRRKFQRNFVLLKQEENEKETWEKVEIDSEEELYNDKYQFATRKSPNTPINLQIMESRVDEESALFRNVSVEELVIKDFDNDHLQYRHGFVSDLLSDEEEQEKEKEKEEKDSQASSSKSSVVLEQPSSSPLDLDGAWKDKSVYAPWLRNYEILAPSRDELDPYNCTGKQNPLGFPPEVLMNLASLGAQESSSESESFVPKLRYDKVKQECRMSLPGETSDPRRGVFLCSVSSDES